LLVAQAHLFPQQKKQQVKTKSRTVGVTHLLLTLLELFHVINDILDHILELTELNLHGLQLFGLSQLCVINRL
jgi:hypothetical protein